LVACGAYCYYRRKPVAEEDSSSYHELKDVKAKGTNLDGNGPGAPGAPVSRTVAAEVRKQFEKEYTELKADMKKGVASTNQAIAAADASGDYEATVPLKRRLDVFDSLYAKLKEIQPASSFWNIRISDASVVESQTLLRELEALRLAMPDLSIPSTPSETLSDSKVERVIDGQNPSHVVGSFATTDAEDISGHHTN
jgi:hypothetical protein